MSILMPSLSKARLLARRAQGASNQKQISLALSVYQTEDRKGRMPPTLVTRTINDLKFTETYPHRIPFWAYLYPNYIKDYNFFFAPSGYSLYLREYYRTNSAPDWWAKKDNYHGLICGFFYWYEYNPNPYVYKDLPFASSKNVKRPTATTPILSDIFFQWSGDPLGYVANFDLATKGGPKKAYGANWLYLDGHVTWRAREEMKSYIRWGSVDMFY